MTKQAGEVLSACDFGKADLHDIERVLCSHTVNQVVGIVRRKDPEGKHESFSWFLPLFGNYVPRVMSVSCVFSPEFWLAYDKIDGFVDPFDVSLLPLVGEMAGDMARLVLAMSKSAPNLKYLYKVWSSIQVSRVENTTVVPEIVKHEVRTTELD